MKISMIGTGYVGLVSGTCFAELGWDVTCLDIDKAKIEALEAGRIPIYEPGLEGLVAKNVAAGRLSFTTDYAKAVSGRDAVFIAVGTPPGPQDGEADLSYVYACARQIARHIDGRLVIVDKSTVPVGTGSEVARIVREERPDAAFDIVSNPEFLREGAAVQDFLNPDRIVLGVSSDHAASVMRRLYAPLSDKGHRVMMTDVASAELTKYASNAFLAMKVAFINEVADICERVGADVSEVAKGMGMDDRIGPKFLKAGPGYGGSCFPKDTKALAHSAKSCGVPSMIVEAVITSNNNRKNRIAEKVQAALGNGLQGKRIALLGLTFKADTDDMRDSPAINIANVLSGHGADVVAYDPQGMENAKSILAGITYADSTETALAGSDCAVIATEWSEFAALTPEKIKALMKQPVIVDLRNIFARETMEAGGVNYSCVGRV